MKERVATKAHTKDVDVLFPPEHWVHKWRVLGGENFPAMQ